MDDKIKKTIYIGGQLLHILTLREESTFDQLTNKIMYLDRDEYNAVLYMLENIGLIVKDQKKETYRLKESLDESRVKLKFRLIKSLSKPDLLDDIFPNSTSLPQIYLIKVSQNKPSATPLKGSIFEFLLNYDQYKDDIDHGKLIIFFGTIYGDQDK